MSDFISDNPALAAYYNTANNDRAQADGDIQLRNAQQTEGANNAIDTDLRQWFAKGSPQQAAAPAAAQPQIASPGPSGDAGAPPAAPSPQGAMPSAAPGGPAPATGGTLAGIGVEPTGAAASTMAQTPGTGRFMMGMAQQQYQRRQDMTFKMFDAMDKGDLPAAQYLSQQVGFNLPPQAWNDVRTIRQLGQAKYFQPMFKDDEPGFGAFLSDAMRSADQNGGTPDWQSALQRNAPRSKGEVAYAGYTKATGEKPSQYSAEAMFGGRDMRPFAPMYGTTTVLGEDGKPQVVQVNRRDPREAPTPVGPAVPRSQNAPITQIDRDRNEAERIVQNDPAIMGAKPEVRDAAINREMDRIVASRPPLTAPRVDQGAAQNGPSQAPAGQKHAGTQQDPHAPQNDADFAALPKGAIYTDPGDGKLYRKP